MHEVIELLGAWAAFYTMVGSAAAALTGLMFVVITLVSDDQRGASEEGVTTFSSPTVVHFCTALFTAGLMLMPFRSFVPISVGLALVGIVGSFVVARIALRTWRLTTANEASYRPDAEDWVFHVVLPIAGYAALVFGAIALHVAPSEALFAPAFGAILLVFVGIHNAWDVVTFLATGKAATSSNAADSDGKDGE